jgi:hypothetical protein
MKTTELFKISSNKINESIEKVFGKKINLETFDLAQLQDARNKLRTQVSQIRGSSEFNENLENDAFHQAQWMLDAINAEIAEREEFSVDASTAEASYEEGFGSMEEKVAALLKRFDTDMNDIGGYGDPDVKEIIQHLKNGDAESAAEVVWYAYTDQDGGEFPEKEPYVDDLQAEFEELADGGDQDTNEGKMSEIDIDLQSLANRGDEEDLIAALDGDMGPGTADVLQNMMDELKDELASKGMNDVINDQDKMIEMLWDKIVDEYGGDDDSDEGGETDDNYALASAGFGSDEDYESIQYEDRVDEKAVSKSQQQAAGIALAAKRKGETPPGKGAAAQMAKMSTKELEKYAGTKHKGLPDKKDESVDQGEDMTKLQEGEIQQASAIVTAKTMVDRVGRWIEELSGMENDTLLQLGDSIRDEIGQEQAKAFIEAVAPAIQQALETLKGTRDSLSNSVRTLATGEQPADMLGAEPAAGGEEEMGPVEPVGDMEAPAEPAGDEFAAAEPAAGGAEAAGREQRESIQYQNRLLKVLAG